MQKVTFAAIALVLLGSQAATAQTVEIRRDGPDVVIDRPPAESKTVETRETADGCRSKTVTRTDDLGDRTTVRKETCD